MIRTWNRSPSKSFASLISAIAFAIATAAPPTAAQDLLVISGDKTFKRINVGSGSVTSTAITGLTPETYSITGAKRNAEYQGSPPSGDAVLQIRILTNEYDEYGPTGRYGLNISGSSAMATSSCLTLGGWTPDAPPLVGFGSNQNEVLMPNTYTWTIDTDGNLYLPGSCSTAPNGVPSPSLMPVGGTIVGACARGAFYVLKQSTSSVVLSKIQHTTGSPPAVTQTWNVTNLVGAGQILGMTLDQSGRMWAYVNRYGSCTGHGWGDLIVARTDETFSASALTLRTLIDVGDTINGGVGCPFAPRAFLFFDHTGPTGLALSGPTSVNACEKARWIATWDGGPTTGILQPGSLEVTKGIEFEVDPPDGALQTYTLSVTGLTGAVGTVSLPLTSVATTIASPTASDSTPCAGTQVTFSAAIANAPSGSTVRWRKGSASGPIVATGNPSTNYAPATIDSGLYFATVEGSCPTVASTPVTLNVLQAATVGTPSGGGTKCSGSTATLSFPVGGVPLPEWKLWRTSVTPPALVASGVAGTSPVTCNVTASEDATYTLEVWNDCSPTVHPTSVPVTITVATAPVISDLAPTTSVCGTASYMLSTSHQSGDGPVSWQWSADGEPIPGANAATYTVPSSNTSTTVTYSVTATNSSPLGCRTDTTQTVFTRRVVKAPDSITATQETVCSGGSTTLTAVGGSGESVQWFSGSCGGASVPSSGDSITVAPLMTTRYFARWNGGPCGDSECVEIEIRVSEPPVSCESAEAWSSGSFDTTCAPDGSSLDCVRRGAWYVWTPSTSGTATLMATATFDDPAAVAKVAAWSGTCALPTLLGCGTSGLTFPVEAGTPYRLHLGADRDAGGPGIATITVAVPSGCPSGPHGYVDTYLFTGSASGNPWSWKIRSSTGAFAEIRNNSVPALPSGTSAELIATAFAQSINATKTCSDVELLATPNPLGISGKMKLAYRGAAGGGTLQLYVGPAGDPSCPVTTASSGSNCTFLLPSISVEREDVPASDCNLNGEQDFIDLILGTSNDLDGDGVPDECSQGTGTGLCFGDGNGTPCPCGNSSPVGAQEGCLNSLGTGGRLVAGGSASLASDTLFLDGSGMPNSSALYFQGTSAQSGGAGVAFGDGLRCAGGAILRLGVRTNSNGSSQYPQAGDPSISVKGQVVLPGTTRIYQVWYRNGAVFCTASTYNLTNARQIVWQP